MAMRAVGTVGKPASETVVNVASRLLSALIINGRMNEGNRASLVRFAVRLALDVSQEAERAAAGAGETREPRAVPLADVGAAPAPDADVAADDILDLLD